MSIHVITNVYQLHLISSTLTENKNLLSTVLNCDKPISMTNPFTIFFFHFAVTIFKIERLGLNILAIQLFDYSCFVQLPIFLTKLLLAPLNHCKIIKQYQLMQSMTSKSYFDHHNYINNKIKIDFDQFDQSSDRHSFIGLLKF